MVGDEFPTTQSAAPRCPLGSIAIPKSTREPKRSVYGKCMAVVAGIVAQNNITHAYYLNNSNIATPCPRQISPDNVTAADL
jgi:hypothetical protein